MENHISFDSDLDTIPAVFAVMAAWAKSDPEGRRRLYTASKNIGEILNSIVPGATQYPLHPAPKAWIPAPAGLRARLGDELLRVQYLGETGGLPRPIILYAGALVYADDMPTYLGLADVTA